MAQDGGAGRSRLVRHIGTSNMTIPKMELLLRDARIRPAVNEMELHPHFQQPEFFRYLVDKGIQPVGYSPLGSPARPDRDRTPQDTTPTEDPVICSIARRLGVHPAIVCIKWAIQRGQIPIPFSAIPVTCLVIWLVSLASRSARRIWAQSRNSTATAD